MQVVYIFTVGSLKLFSTTALKYAEILKYNLFGFVCLLFIQRSLEYFFWNQKNCGKQCFLNLKVDLPGFCTLSGTWNHKIPITLVFEVL